jgi:hypothetical protein
MALAGEVLTPAGTRSRRWSRFVLAATGLLAMATYATLPAVSRLAERTSELELASPSVLGFPAVALAFSTTGWVIHRHRPQHAVGWVLHGIGACAVATMAGVLLGEVHSARPHSTWLRIPAAVLGFAWMPLLLSVTVLLPLLFPTGRPPTHRWRWLAWAAAGGMAAWAVLVTVQAVREPIEDVFAAGSASEWTMSVIVAVGALGGLASVVARLRRAGDVERRQLMWVLLSFSFIPLLGTVFAVGHAAGLDWNTNVIQVSFVLAFVAVPVSIGIAITRFHLYEIDRLVSRTATYTVVTTILAGVYVGCVLVLQELVPAGGSDLAVAAATLVVAGSFRPVRRWAQTRLDRHFDRARYEAGRIIEMFGSRLRRDIDLDALSRDLLGVVHDTMRPTVASLWLSDRAAGTPEAGVAHERADRR